MLREKKIGSNKNHLRCSGQISNWDWGAVTQKHVYNHAGMEIFFPGTNSLPAGLGRDVFPICKGEALPSRAPPQQGGRIPRLVQLTHGHSGCRWRRSKQLQDGTSGEVYHTSLCLLFICTDVSSCGMGHNSPAGISPANKAPGQAQRPQLRCRDSLHCLAARQLSPRPG